MHILIISSIKKIMVCKLYPWNLTIFGINLKIILEWINKIQSKRLMIRRIINSLESINSLLWDSFFSKQRLVGFKLGFWADGRKINLSYNINAHLFYFKFFKIRNKIFTQWFIFAIFNATQFIVYRIKNS